MGLPSAHKVEVHNPAAGELAIKNATADCLSCQVHVCSSQQRQKHYYDTERIAAAYEVGAQLLLSPVGSRLKVLRVGTEKLQPKGWDPVNALKTLLTSWNCQKQCAFMTCFASHC